MMSFEIALKSLPIFYAFTIAINFFSVFYKGSHGIFSSSLHNRRFFGVLQACEENREATEERQTREKRSPEKRAKTTPVMRTMFHPSYSVAFVALGCYRRSFTPFCEAFFPSCQTNPQATFSVVKAVEPMILHLNGFNSEGVCLIESQLPLTIKYSRTCTRNYLPLITERRL